MSDQYVLVVSELDSAGRTMLTCLRDDFSFQAEGPDQNDLSSTDFPNVRLHVSGNDLLHLEDLDELYPQAKCFVFLSKHKSDSKIPTLTCHCTGNFGHNPFGGNPGEIGISYPSLQKSYVRSLVAVRDRVPGYEIVIEATHHGPTSLQKPVMFAELGSSEKEWEDSNAARLICETLLGVIKKCPERCSKVGIAVGGNHYPSKFNRLLIETDYGLAAVASKHNLKFVNEGMLGQMRSKSIEQVTMIVLDNKGLGSDKGRIIRLAESSGLEILNLK